MSKRPDIDERVKDAVRAWSRAADIERAAARLEHARRDLPPELRPQLVSEVSEISAELLIAVLCRTDGLDPGAEPVEVQGEALHPKQAERLGAWLEDQRVTARALGVEPDAWLRALEGGFERYARAASGSEPSGETAPAVDSERARRLLGSDGGVFEARPPAKDSPKAGLTGLLAARTFPSKKQR